MSFFIDKKNPLFILLVCLVYCTACSKNPPAKASCEQLDELVKMMGSDDLFNLPADEFIEKYKHLMKVESDDSGSIVAPFVWRTVRFKPVQGDWLDNAENHYESDPADTVKIRLNMNHFVINPNCKLDIKQVDTQFSRHIPSRWQTHHDYIKNSLEWSSAAPENSQLYRYISVDIGSDYTLISTSISEFGPDEREEQGMDEPVVDESEAGQIDEEIIEDQGGEGEANQG
ncbi:MAG TPA: hypothetical protein VN030_15295 [Cellvibrio sp.]|nr:hypothetical protein [Cellvibrio sp.]